MNDVAPKLAAARSTLAVPSWSWSRFTRLAAKELRETLRDRRTIVTLVLMPVLVYPLLGVALQQFVLSGRSSAGDVSWRIGAPSAKEMDLFKQVIDVGDRLLRDTADTPPLPAANNHKESARPRIEYFEASDVESRLTSLDIDLGVRLLSEPAGIGTAPVRFELVLRADMPLSRQVAEHVEARLRAFNSDMLRRQLPTGDRDEPPAVVWKWQSVQQPAARPFPLASLAPMMLILMTITGAVYPAIDLTAGERERGTLEALMSAPVPRMSLLGAKYVAVVTVALLTAIANLTAMSITLRGTGLGEALLGPGGMSLGVLGLILLLLGLFAAFFSAVLLAITCFARSFKEAQAYLIPLMLLSLGPGIASLIPGIELNGILAVAPLLNIVLLARDVMQGTAAALPATVAVVSTAIYAAAALAVAAKIFGSDAVLYGSDGGWSEMLRRPETPLARPTLAGAGLAAAIVYPLYFAINGLMTSGAATTASMQLMFSALGTVIVFALTPLLFAWRQRVRIGSGFQLQAPPLLSLVGALLLGVSLWPLAHEVFVLVRMLGIGTVTDEQIAEKLPQVESMLAGWRQLPPAAILLVLGLLTGACEELFFRGYLLGALRGRAPAWLAIVSTAALFGVFHLSVGGLAATERVVTSAALGGVLGWTCWRTGSVWPGMLTHVLHNSLLLSIAYWKDILPQGEIAATTGHLPTTWIAAAAAGTTVGLAIIYAATRRTDRAGEPRP